MVIVIVINHDGQRTRRSPSKPVFVLEVPPGVDRDAVKEEIIRTLWEGMRRWP